MPRQAEQEHVEGSQEYPGALQSSENMEEHLGKASLLGSIKLGFEIL